MVTNNSINANKVGLQRYDGAGIFDAVTTTNHDVLIGATGNGITNVAPSATSGVPLISQGAAADPAFGTAVVAGGGTGQTTLTNHAVLVGAATTAITQLTVGTNGQVLVGATGADPAFATLTSSDSSITFTTGANTLSLQVSGGTSVGKTITGDTGGALSPTAGNWNLLGSGSITTAGSGSTLTTQLTGLTNHNVLIGAGTTTITKVAPSATSGVPLISQGASSDPVFGTAAVAGGGTGLTATPTNGQLLIGNGSGYTLSTLTAGSNITITNGSGSITIASTASSVPSFTYISTQTASASTNLDFTSLTNAYRGYRFVITSIVILTSGAFLRIAMSTNNFSTSASLTATVIKYAAATGGAGALKGSDSGTTIDLCATDAASQSSKGYVDVFYIGESTIQVQANFDVASTNGDTIRKNFNGYITDITRESINAVRFTVSSGTMTSGNVHMYGIG